MDIAVHVEDLGKKFSRRGGDRPPTLKEMILRGRLPTRAHQFWGLRNVSFTVAKGRAVGIVGRNGAGKSTLLRMIGGVGRPDEGSLEVNGRLGALLDLGAGLTNDLTGRENVVISGVISGLTLREIRKSMDEIVAFAELERFIDDPIRTYSTGMRMRLAFAVAAHIDPDILLLDEVLAVGDAAFQRKCMDRIAQFKTDGATIFLVSHDASAVRAFCDDALLLEEGHAVAFGPVQEVLDLYEAPHRAGAALSQSRNAVETVSSAGVSLRMDVNRFGSQEVEICAVRLMNPQGGETNCIAAGAGLVIEVAYAAQQEVAAPVVYVEVHRADGVACFATNNTLSGLDLVEPNGAVTLRIDRLDLAGGEYFVTIGLFTQDWRRPYDLHARAYPLQVIGAHTGSGVMNPPCGWSLGASRSDIVGSAGDRRTARPITR